jgi:hypothetical protein
VKSKPVPVSSSIGSPASGWNVALVLVEPGCKFPTTIVDTSNDPKSTADVAVKTATAFSLGRD